MKSVIAIVICLIASAVQAEVLLSRDEIARTLTFGPWPPSASLDASNGVSGSPEAIALGAALFKNPLLSTDGQMTCASCHDPLNAFTTDDARARGRTILRRNSPSLFNLRGLRWYGWGGRSDSLWAASIHPIIASAEMGHSPDTLKSALENSPFRTEFEALFGSFSLQTSETVLVNTAKILAAYLETQVTERSAFDDFRDALANEDFAEAGQYPLAAQRGLKIFLGRGNCAFCHNGPRFSNNEFHDAGIPYFLSDTAVDPGRFEGIERLQSSRYTQAGDWSDDPEKRGAWAVLGVKKSHSDFGTFRTPSLRGVAETAPYMHAGSLETLEEVIGHYSNIDLERLHADGEAILRPFDLSPQDVEDVVAFLQSLSSARQSTNQ